MSKQSGVYAMRALAGASMAMPSTAGQGKGRAEGAQLTQQHDGAQPHLASPERREQRRHHPQMLHILRVLTNSLVRNLWHHVIHHQLVRLLPLLLTAVRRYSDFDRRRVEIPWRTRPVHAVASIWRGQLDRLTGGQVERLVRDEHGLRVVAPWRNVLEGPCWVALRAVGGGDGHGLSGGHSVYILADDMHGGRRNLADLKPRLGCRQR